MKDKNFINVNDAKELSVRDAHLAVIDNLPEGFMRVDFDNPESVYSNIEDGLSDEEIKYLKDNC